MTERIVHRIEMAVRFNEADPLGIVWHGHYIRYFEDGREDFGKKYGLAYLDGWEASRGAHIEIRIARDIEIPIMGWREWRRRAPDLLSIFTP